MFPGRYTENEWSKDTTHSHLSDVASGDLSIEGVSIENNKVRCGIPEQEGITVPALRPLHAKSLSSEIMPPHFFTSEA